MSAETEGLPTPESIADYVKKNTQKVKGASAMMMMHHEGGQEVLREDDYKGHHITVRTVYHITVDGKEVTGHIMLTNDGQVQYHGLPNLSFDSTIDLVKSLIDNFPEDFEAGASSPHDDMSNMDMGGHGSHGDMAKPAKKPVKSAKTAAKKQPAAKPKSSNTKARRPAARRKSK